MSGLNAGKCVPKVPLLRIVSTSWGFVLFHCMSEGNNANLPHYSVWQLQLVTLHVEILYREHMRRCFDMNERLVTEYVHFLGSLQCDQLYLSSLSGPKGAFHPVSSVLSFHKICCFFNISNIQAESRYRSAFFIIMIFITPISMTPLVTSLPPSPV